MNSYLITFAENEVMFINPSNDSPNYIDLITLEIQNTEIGIRSF